MAYVNAEVASGQGTATATPRGDGTGFWDIEATPAPGWRFEKWTIRYDYDFYHEEREERNNPTEVNDSTSQTLISVTCYAYFYRPPTYTITVKAAPSDVGFVRIVGREGKSEVFEEGEVCTVRAHTNWTNWVFVGWMEGNVGVSGDAEYSFEVASDRTLTAVFQYGRFTVTFDKAGGGGGTDSVTVKYGEAMPTIIPPTWSGYVFEGYFEVMYGVFTKYYNADGTSARAWDHFSDMTLHARWRENAGTGKLIYDPVNGRLLCGSGGTLLYDGDY